MLYEMSQVLWMHSTHRFVYYEQENCEWCGWYRFDVKCGKGAFMKDLDHASELAQR